MSENPPEHFRQFCTAEVNDDGTVTVAVALRDKVTGEVYRFDKTVDPEPIARYIAHQFAMMNGDTSVAGIGSFLSKAKSAALKVASTKGIKEVWKAASPIMKELAKEVPGGSAAMALATKTADTVAAARKGSKSAIATLKNAAIKAANGNELAAEVMKTAKTLSTMMDVKEGKDSPELAHRLALVERALHPLIPNPTVPQSPYKVGAMMPLRDALKRAKSAKAAKQRFGMPKRNAERKFVAPKASVPPPVVKRMAMPAQPEPLPEEIDEELTDYAMEMAEEGYGEDEIAEEISGWRDWLYSRPFRTPAKAMLQGDFGASTTMRSLYANGLESVASLKRN